ncbi:MAG: D-alanyl-D-alanine carboxypeptidase [Gammaproteobacteria bacterium]|nr:D-alanyl-D-alanine carboxypeptidase [Gammaproteobacteria bacterium]
MKLLSLLKAVIVISFLLFWFSVSVAAPSLTPTPPTIKGKGYLLVDFNSGRVIAEKEADTRMEPASLTKIMSSYVAENELREGNIKLEDGVVISKKAWKMQGSRMFVEVGKTVTVEELLLGVIIQSGNDATVALAEHIAGSEDAFVSLMNQHAKALGMDSTHFVNSTGLPHIDHYTTPRDMATMASALIKHFPEHYDWYAKKEFEFNGIKQYNRNKLLWRDKYVDGIKTGHTESAGFCLVASAKRDGMRLISVLLGANSENTRVTESQKLLGYGFRFFETHQLYAANAVLTEAPIWKGEVKTVPLGLTDDLYVTVPRGQYKKLDASMTITAEIIAPTKKGQKLGMVQVKLGDESFAERDLVALEAVESGSLWNNLIDEVKLMFK